MLLMGGTYPPDIRVAKEAKVLRSAGHEVFLLTSDRDGRPAAERVGEIDVTRYPARAGFVSSKLSALATLATWRSPLLKRHIANFVEHNRIEALHVHDLPAVAMAADVGRSRKIPVSFDMHENYPAAITFWDRSTVARLFQTPERYRAYEREAVVSVDRVIAVVDESAERIRSLGVPAEKVVVFSNVDDREEVVSWEGSAEPFTVAYAGGFQPHRGIDVLIRALPELRVAVPGSRLLLMGRGSDEAELRDLAESLAVAEAIEWTGWVDTEQMRGRLASASVGVVPHLRNAHTDSTVPHKLFQYMAMGLPVTVTDCAPLARIVRETGAGTVAKAGDAADLAAKMAELADPERARAASAAGRDAVAQRYNLQREGESLVRMYEELAPTAEAAPVR